MQTAHDSIRLDELNEAIQTLYDEPVKRWPLFSGVHETQGMHDLRVENHSLPDGEMIRMNEPVLPVIGLILAAGRSKRFAGDKRRALLPDGRSMLQTSIDNARQCFAEVWVVLRDDDDVQTLGIAHDIRIVRSRQADLGMGHSLASGIEALMSSPACAVAILLADMPWLRAETLRSLVRMADPQRIAQPVHAGQRGHPVIIGRQFWPELLSLEGDQGARKLLATHAQVCDLMETNDPGTLRDVDTPEQLHVQTLL